MLGGNRQLAKAPLWRKMEERTQRTTRTAKDESGSGLGRYQSFESFTSFTSFTSFGSLESLMSFAPTFQQVPNLSFVVHRDRPEEPSGQQVISCQVLMHHSM